MSSKVFIVCPGDAVTGGPHALHQLAHELNRDGKNAFMLYYPFDRPFNIPQPYQRYTTYPAMVEDVEPGSIVVLPEVRGDLITAFPGSKVFFWWLSVDNFLSASGDRAHEYTKLMHHIDTHLYQSEHARSFIEELGPFSSAQLMDYLGDEYTAGDTDAERVDMVVYNPQKGMQRTAPILELLAKRRPDVAMLPLSGMSARQVRKILSRAKVYIDFGSHPGKDRLPREAAAMGCCVITNRRGSAGNSVDVPIRLEYKVNDKLPQYEFRAAIRICEVLDNFEHHQARFASYRAVIAGEAEQFAADARAAFAEVLA